MSKKQKLYQKILSGSKNIRFSDLVTLLLAFGFRLDRQNGSHRIFKHPKVTELLSLQETSNDRAKPYQIRQFPSLVEAYGLQLDVEAEDEESEDQEEDKEDTE